MSSIQTVEEYERTVALLKGRRIRTVVYYPLTGGEDGCEIEDWDFGPWYQPTMGVELFTDEGACFRRCGQVVLITMGWKCFPGR